MRISPCLPVAARIFLLPKLGCRGWEDFDICRPSYEIKHSVPPCCAPFPVYGFATTARMESPPPLIEYSWKATSALRRFVHAVVVFVMIIKVVIN